MLEVICLPAGVEYAEEHLYGALDGQTPYERLRAKLRAGTSPEP
jgi:hypothetical protein